MKNLYTLMLIVLIPAFMAAQNFTTIIDGAGEDVGKAFMNDFMAGGWISAGYTSSLGNGGKDVYLVKFDINGDTVFTRTFGGTHDEEANSACMFNPYMKGSEAYAVGGYTFNGSDKDLYFFELDYMIFDLYGTKTIDFGYGDDELLRMRCLEGALVTGAGYYTTASGDKNLFITNMDDDFSSFDTLFVFKFGGAGEEAANDVAGTEQNPVAAGYSTSFGGGDKDAYLVKYDVAQTMISFEKHYGGAGDDEIKAIVYNPFNMMYVAAGYTESQGAGGRDIWYMKLNALGDTVWTRTFGDIYDDEANDIFMYNDTTYVITGYKTSESTGDKNIVVMTFSSNTGDMLSYDIIGDEGYDEIGYGVAQLSCENLIIGDYHGDYIFMKTDAILLNPEVTDVSCFGMNDGAILINPTGGSNNYLITWNDDSMNQIAQNVLGVNSLLPDTFFLSFYDQVRSCMLYDTFIVAEPLLLTLAQSGTPASCGGICDGEGVVTPSGGVEPYVYLWDAGAGNATDSLVSYMCYGNYGVTVTDANGCMVNTTVMIDELPFGYISGIINPTSYGAIPDDSAMVYLLKFENTYIVDTMNAYLIYNSQYEFTDVYAGNYLIKVELNPGMNFPNVLDTYHDSTFTWDIALIQNMACGDTVSLVTSMYEMTPMSTGNGTISGYINFWDGSKAFGEPVPGAEVYIEQEPNDEPIASSETDTSGYYGFGAVGTGNDYKLLVDIPGLPLISTYSGINITAADTLWNNLNFYVDTSSGNEGIYVDATGINETVFQVYFNAYPNPFGENLNIEYSIAETAEVELQVYDISGKLMETIISKKQEAGEYRYTFAKEDNGIYIVKLRINNTSVIRKVVATD
ncbi:MAG: T9SS type A sorting domain-containing protein [Bacteroidota bacterium]